MRESQQLAAPCGNTLLGRSDDIYIATYPRSGTTLMQMMLYQLNSSGDMTFTHIDDVMPFFEKARRSGIDLEALPSPRVFKTHLPYRAIGSKPGRFIYVARDGKDVLFSYFHLYKTYIEPDLTFEGFFELFLSGKVQYGSWFEHTRDWMAHRGDPRILFLRFEDVVQDLDRSIDRVLRFLEWHVSDEQRHRTIERCSLAFMRQHEEKFEPVQARVLPDVPSGSFIRSGVSGGWRNVFTQQQCMQFETCAADYASRELR
jgi:hypothetical protein